MGIYLGIDTSNYTTSTALVLNSGEVVQEKQLLPVKEGALGLRQSDALFHHVQQLPQLLEKLFSKWPVHPHAIGVSTRPRNVDGSYMPCFLAGEAVARGIASSFHIPLVRTAHQNGHIMAALYSCGRMDLVQKRFLAFHVSGGTTEALLVEPDSCRSFTVRLLAGSRDLKAGQAVDRIGSVLGLSFPAGRALEELALQCDKPIRVHPVLQGMDCSLSGVENQCQSLLTKGETAPRIARFCIDFIGASIEGMTERILNEYGNLPVLYAGGVMSNTIIRKRLERRFGGLFADPSFSTDNAAGVALLCQKEVEKI